MRAEDIIDVGQGATFERTYTVYDEDGDEEDLSACTIQLTVKSDLYALTAELVLGVGDGITILDQVTSRGKFQVTITDDQTALLPVGRHVFDVWRETPGGDVRDVVRTTPLIVRPPVRGGIVSAPASTALPARWRRDVTVWTGGDSRAAQGSPYNWQEYLYNLLKPYADALGLNLRFVGKDNGPVIDGAAIWESGYPGATIYDLRQAIAADLALRQPDIVVVLIGVNDFNNPPSVAPWSGIYNAVYSATEFGNLLNTIEAATSSRARIIVCRDPGFTLAWAGATSDKIAQHDLYNSLLDDMVNPPSGFQGTMVRDILLVDCAAGFDPATMTYDGVHQNALGAQFIAGQIFNGVKVGGFGS
jgi:lysophospholipase L1-like esterase